MSHFLLLLLLLFSLLLMKVSLEHLMYCPAISVFRVFLHTISMLMFLAYLRRYQDVHVGFFSKPKKERDFHVVRYLIWLLVVCSQIN